MVRLTNATGSPTALSPGDAAHLVEGLAEGPLHHPVVRHRGPRHVEGGQTGSSASPAQPVHVCSAMAGDSVMPRPARPVITTTPGSTSARKHTRPSVAAEYTPAHRRTTGGSDHPRISSARAAQPVVEELLDGEVEGLLVDVGVADRETPVGALDEQELHPERRGLLAEGGGR